MIKISKAATNIQPSLTRKLFNMAKEYENVIDFTLGDPDIPTPTPIKEAGCKAIMENKTRYSQNAGLIDLRQAIANYIFKKEQLTYSPENEILVSVGAMEGLYLSLLATIDSGDEVIIPAPYYVNYKQMVEMCGGVPIIVEDYDHIKEFKCSVNKIKEAITPKTVAIILNTPCNPTGKVFSQEFISQIAEVSKEKNLMVITDEVYKSLVYNGNMRPKSIASLPDMKERTIFINSLSKEFCMTGWRVGYVAANREIITAMTKLQWLLLNYHDWSYTDMVDKYRVKPIVAKIIGENHIIPTYGAWDSFDKIDFDSLPDQFVLKCNHDSGGLVICTDKSKLDKNAARKKIMKSLKKNFYYRTREYAYKNVKPVVLAEKYMVDDTGWQLKDYKVFCFNGEPTYIEVDYDRFVGHKLNVYDLNWNFVDFYMTSKNDPNANIKKPAKFETMIEMARKLAKGTPFVRVDFYIDRNDEIFFGEMTYTPGTGHIHFTPDDWDFKLGELLILPEKNV